jgi:sucrose phosphorylase
MYDFYFPALVIDALDRGVSRFLIQWINEIQKNGFSTLNMLGCHDGIPVLDLKGCEGHSLLPAEDIEAIVERIVARGGRVKNLFGPDGKKIAYYQVNATFFSALGEDERKLLLARAIQMFMPGTPQIWYLDLFAGKNNYAAADVGGTASHKEINRTNLSVNEIEDGLERPVVLKQLELIRLRNISPAFQGDCRIDPGAENELKIRWENGAFSAVLRADLKNHGFSVEHGQNGKIEQVLTQQ